MENAASFFLYWKAFFTAFDEYSTLSKRPWPTLIDMQATESDNYVSICEKPEKAIDIFQLNSEKI